VHAPLSLSYQKKGPRRKLGSRRIGDAAMGFPSKYHLIAKWGPASLMAEQYRVAATRVILMTAEKKHAVTLVTSSVMGEGKTTTAANLAYILAHDLNRKTLLIDCDFKRPMIHEYMEINLRPGLLDMIEGTYLLDDCLHRYEDLSLWVLPTGKSGRRPMGLSEIQYIEKLLPDLRTHYDNIILDGPPVMPLADVNVINNMADMLLFVIQAGGTSQDLAKKAFRSLGETNGAGIILTQVEMEYAPYFTYYAYPYANEDSGSRT